MLAARRVVLDPREYSHTGKAIGKASGVCLPFAGLGSIPTSLVRRGGRLVSRRAHDSEVGGSNPPPARYGERRMLAARRVVLDPREYSHTGKAIGKASGVCSPLAGLGSIPTSFVRRGGRLASRRAHDSEAGGSNPPPARYGERRMLAPRRVVFDHPRVFTHG